MLAVHSGPLRLQTQTLRNLRAYCSTVALCWVTIIWQRIFKGSLQDAIVNAFFRMWLLTSDIFDRWCSDTVTQWRRQQRWARIRAGSGLKPILAGTGLDRTAIFSKIGGSGLNRTEKFFLFLCDYSENIKNFSCDPITQVCSMAVHILPSKCKPLLGLFCNLNFILLVFIFPHEARALLETFCLQPIVFG